MYKLYVKIAMRYLFKNKLYSFINIAGLAIGIASFVLIILYVNYEYSYDTFEGSENVQRVYMDYTEEGVFVPGDAQTYNLSGPTLKENFPEIKEFVRLGHITDVAFKHDNKFIDGEKGTLADPTYFDVFKYPLLKGDVQNVLKEPYTILLTESLSKKIFGKENPIGRSLTIVYRGNAQFTVEGILKDLPETTHIKNDFLISFSTMLTWESYRDNPEPNWRGNNLYTYVKLDRNTDVGILKKKIMDFKVEALPFERHNIEPLEDIHLYSDKPFEAEANGSASRVKFLMAIALIIIVLSWLNYVNLSTSKSMERAKETGIRKVAGAQRPQIIIQSVLEALLLNLVAITIAIILVLLVLPAFNGYVGKELAIGFSSISDFLPILGFVLLGTVLSGIYPAIILSNYSPTKALKGEIRTSSGGFTIRKGLIVGQFIATIILLIGTIVVTKQIRFLQDQPLGVDLERVIALSGKIMDYSTDSVFIRKARALENELVKLPFVKSTARAQTYPGETYDDMGSRVGITFPDGTRDDSRVWYSYEVGPRYFDLMDMKFLAGGPFLPNSEGFNDQIVMNEKFVRHMGISNMEAAVDKVVKIAGENYTISGVIEDYHHFGLKTSIEPILLTHNGNFGKVLVKLDQNTASASGMKGVISQIERKWKEVFTQSTFEYRFLDQRFEAQYNEDKAFGAAFQIFTVLAILIASMGLFGLTSYTCLQRRKEIGIRKVNGATIVQVLTLLNKDFVKWVSLAFIIAVPISWFAMQKWLEGFAYKTSMSWWIFALAGLTALVIALLTVSWQSFRAAVANPVEALKEE